jgi:DNA-binding winged helix-turn-helix (wHTH) protein
MEPSRHTSGARFGTFEVWFDSGELSRAGLRVRVQQQPLKLLKILLEHPGEPVSREQLRNRLWDSQSFGDFDQAVNIAIGKLRSALGDSAENPLYIETLPKHGYRFIGNVFLMRRDDPAEGLGPDLPESSHIGFASIASPPGHPDAATQVAEGLDPPEALPRKRQRIAVAVAIVLALLILAGFLALRSAMGPSGIQSLAVLPLDNFSGDASQDYFADGMTDELITNLAQIRALRVVSRTSVMMYKGTRKPLR